MIRIEIEGSDIDAVHASMRSLLPPQAATLDDYTLQELVALIEKRARADDVDISITMPGDRKSPAEQRKAEARAKLRGELEESLKQEEPTLEEPVKPAKKAAKKANGPAESEEDRKARLSKRLVDLFNAGAGANKAAVRKLLADYGDGAKTFSGIDASRFVEIGEAMDQIDWTE